MIVFSYYDIDFYYYDINFSYYDIDFSYYDIDLSYYDSLFILWYATRSDKTSLIAHQNLT